MKRLVHKLPFIFATTRKYVSIIEKHIHIYVCLLWSDILQVKPTIYIFGIVMNRRTTTVYRTNSKRKYLFDLSKVLIFFLHSLSTERRDYSYMCIFVILLDPVDDNVVLIELFNKKKMVSCLIATTATMDLNEHLIKNDVLSHRV